MAEVIDLWPGGVAPGLLRPIRACATAADHLAKGDLTYIPEVTSRDEAGTMAAALGQATATLSMSMLTIRENAHTLAGCAAAADPHPKAWARPAAAGDRIRSQLRDSVGPPPDADLDSALSEFFDLYRIAERGLLPPPPAPVALTPVPTGPDAPRWWAASPATRSAATPTRWSASTPATT